MSGAAGGMALGMASGVMQANIQDHYNQNNTDRQVRAQKEMTDYNQASAMDMWNMTNYEAQRKHMENAGLNVGLMYGGHASGGTSSTIGSPSGSVGAQQTTVDTTKGMGMLLQSEAIKSQIDLNKATEGKAIAETKEVEARTPTYEKGIQKTDAEIQEIATKLGVNVEMAKKIIAETEKTKTEIPNVIADTKVKEAEVPKIQADVKNINLDTNLKRAEINKITADIWKIHELTPSEKAKIDGEITKMVKEVELKGNEVDINKYKAELEGLRPGIFTLISEQFNQALNWARKESGEQWEYDKVKQKVEYRK